MLLLLLLALALLLTPAGVSSSASASRSSSSMNVCWACSSGGRRRRLDARPLRSVRTAAAAQSPGGDPYVAACRRLFRLIDGIG